MTLLTTIVELMESKEPAILEIGKVAPSFDLAATGIHYSTLLELFFNNNCYRGNEFDGANSNFDYEIDSFRKRSEVLH